MMPPQHVFRLEMFFCTTFRSPAGRGAPAWLPLFSATCPRMCRGNRPLDVEGRPPSGAPVDFRARIGKPGNCPGGCGGSRMRDSRQRRDTHAPTVLSIYIPDSHAPPRRYLAVRRPTPSLLRRTLSGCFQSRRHMFMSTGEMPARSFGEVRDGRKPPTRCHH